MPKKRQNRALLTKPASSTPSSLSGKSSASNDGPRSSLQPTVNDLLRESRRPSQKDRKAETLVLSSLPPSVRAVLDLPTPPPPNVRFRQRGPTRLRRVPGPPPPQSWLADSRHAPESARSTFHQLRWIRARIQQQSSTLPGCRLPQRASLEHHVLRAIATNWAWHAEYDNTYLSTLPIPTRLSLLSYLAVYDDAHWPSPLPLLFPPNTSYEDLDSVFQLDLANSLGAWANSVKKIEKELVVTSVGPTVPRDTASVPDSWDEDIPQTVSSSHARFTNLKHLSLAVNIASACAPPSWASLVSMSSHLSSLVSLSLAHWPTPTYTPNAAKGRVQISAIGGSQPAQAFGGTDMYSAFDENWREAAGILKSLSRNLYCLTWLDLTGCGPWLPALTWKDEDDEPGTNWNGSWRNITALTLAVGWLPGKPPTLEDFEAASASRTSSSIDSTRAIEQLYGGSEAIQSSLAHLAELRLGNTPRVQRAATAVESDDMPWNVEHEREKQYFRRDVERYNTQHSTARQVADELKALRRAAGGKYIDFTLGQALDKTYSVD